MDDKHARVTGLARQQGDPVATVAAIVGVALVIGVVCAVLARFHLSAPRPLLPQDPPSRPSTVEHGARPGLEPPAA